jgi:hypothetical protein
VGGVRRALPDSVDVRRLGGAGITIWGPPHRDTSHAQALTVHAAGDVNGDGRDELAVGYPWFPDRTCRDPDRDCDGRHGSSSDDGDRRARSLPHIRPFGYTIRPTAEAEVEDIGAYATSAGDLNGDGRDDDRRREVLGAPAPPALRMPRANGLLADAHDSGTAVSEDVDIARVE